MESSGKITPDSRICGSRNMKAVWIAWPAVCETVEMKTPSPSTTNRNSAAPSTNTNTLPLNGTPKRSMPSPVMMVMSIAATRKYGEIFPKITVLGLMGMTASCSRVPVSRSRTRPMLVTIVPMNVRMSPMMAGTITQEVLSSGLNKICVLTWPPDLLSTDTIDCEANRFEPSTWASTGFWPVMMTTLTVLSCSIRTASAWLSEGRITVTLKNDEGNIAANWVACGPTTAALTVLTSKLAA